LKPILIIGGGISGVTAALELAEAGKQVILVEKSPYLGGNVAKMHNYFPKLCPPACGLEINYRRIKSNPRIKVYTRSELIHIEGKQGDMKATLRHQPEMIKDTCTVCGECVAVCPEDRPDIFNACHGVTKAIYQPQPLAFPQKYDIDPSYCKGEQCGKCVELCAYDAIDLSAEEEEERIDVHSLIVATGWKSYDPEKISELSYGISKDILTNLEFERLLSVTGPFEGKLIRPSDKAVPGSIAFVQCAGSRDRNHLSYCSAVCCSASLKHALNAVEALPGAKATIYYIDLRVSGRNEDFLKRAEQHERIELVKGKVARITVSKESAQLKLEAEHILESRKIEKEFDMIVLATGIVPEKNTIELKMNAEGFHSSLQDEGIYPVACSKKPMDVSTSVKEATAAALKAMAINE